MKSPGRAFFALLTALLMTTSAASAQERRVEIRFTPTARMTYALWIVSADGTIFHTIRLTEAIGRYGIGNRPGALQMNSAFRWPYGRREGSLPIWAHARVAAGGEPFRRVIFQARREGKASTERADSSRDDFFCLSFTDGDEMLDAMTCASVFNSDKGRFITPADITGHYLEPFETNPGDGGTRELSLTSLYPPRRDLAGTCSPEGCLNHADVYAINAEAARVMPDIDVITRPTPSEGVPYQVVFEVPDEWPEGDYTVYLEANTEGDHNEVYGPDEMPTPRTPADLWDSWAITYGYPYRGQPSVLYRADVTIDGLGAEVETIMPVGYSDVHGRDGEIRPMDGTITDDPEGHPGSGVDRLMMSPAGFRLEVELPASNVCGRVDPPPECSMGCSTTNPCPTDFICGEAGMCVGMCDIDLPPGIVPDFEVEPHENIKEAHHYAHLAFTVPGSDRTLESFEVRFGTEPIVDELSFMRARPARRATLESEDLIIPVEGHAAGERIEVDMGGLSPETHYYVGIRAVDVCNDESMLAVAEVTTRPIHFTTVSPCFVATAAYGTPMAEEIRTLRRFRDRHLRSNAPGRALVRAYETAGPVLADTIREHDVLRAAARSALAPWILLARATE